jgi:hypothetical protein
MNSTAEPSAPPSAMASISSPAIFVIAGSSPATRRDVNARAISRLIRACGAPLRFSSQSALWTNTGFSRQPG